MGATELAGRGVGDSLTGVGVLPGVGDDVAVEDCVKALAFINNETAINADHVNRDISAFAILRGDGGESNIAPIVAAIEMNA
jgi:hypothetical protein